jgi:uncharacterized protein YdaU (DUF1376 family)
MKTSPAFQIYPTDFLGSSKVAAMTLEERGAYITLLLHDWAENGLPDDHRVLALYLGLSTKAFKRVWKAVSPCFALDDQGKLKNPRLEKEREKQRIWREKSARGGRMSAALRGHQPSTTLATVVEPEGQPSTQPTGQPKGNTTSLSSLSLTATSSEYATKLIEVANEELGRKFDNFRRIQTDNLSSVRYATDWQNRGIPLEVAEGILRSACRVVNPWKLKDGKLPVSLGFFAKPMLMGWRNYTPSIADLIPAALKGSA